MNQARRAKSQGSSEERRESTRRISPRVAEEGPDFVDAEELAKLSADLDPSDSHFRSELDYDGYQSIEEADNDAYNSRNAEVEAESDRELTITERDNNPSLVLDDEESPIDPQGNQKAD